MSASPPASVSSGMGGFPSIQHPQTVHVNGIVASKVIVAPWHVQYVDVLTPMRDGVKLAGDLYLPAINGVADNCQSN
jgi:predicted acyl esterase